ncbi:MAG: hypothetical protein AAF235_10145 [Planctomycetota bacterium]
MQKTDSSSSTSPLFDAVAARATDAGVFGSIEVRDGMVVCAAANAAEPAFYRVETADGRIWVSLVTENRWLSESIESDLMHTGDKLEELLDEELADLDYTGQSLGFEHFRSDDMLFTFRSALPIAIDVVTAPTADVAAAGEITTVLLGYEACFRQLGDMDETEED